ncbi:hypothetical protein ACN2XU_15055 [Primorskyibacter sp. 2E107]|uniref:hypothetical protein n=1 Tax=Primorskyibacter sp. 2E107 TaxID=3403458 RepID=UPI003AF49BB9
MTSLMTNSMRALQEWLLPRGRAWAFSCKILSALAAKPLTQTLAVFCAIQKWRASSPVPFRIPQT